MRLMPIPKSKRIKNPTGMKIIVQEISPLIIIINSTNTINEIKASIKRVVTIQIGKMILGIYIFLISPSLFINADPDWATILFIKFQGIIPAYRNPVNLIKSTLKIDENTIPMINIIISGLIKVQQ